MAKYLLHVEKVWDNKTWNNLLEFIREYRDNCHLFLMAPQLDYQKSVLGFKGNEKQLRKILLEKYKTLKEMSYQYNFGIGLHIHMTLFPEKLSEKEKLKEFNEASDFLDDIRFKAFYKINMLETIDGVVFGWYKVDDFLRNLCKEKGLPIYNSGFHDYDLPISTIGMLESRMRDLLRRLLR